MHNCQINGLDGKYINFKAFLVEFFLQYGRMLFLHDGNKLPEEGKTYMFCTKYSEGEKAYYASGPTSTIEIEDEKHEEEIKNIIGNSKAKLIEAWRNRPTGKENN